MNIRTLLCQPATCWLIPLLATAVFTSIGAAPALAQQATPAPTTIRLSPDDLERGQSGNQSNFFFLPPGKTGEDNYQSAGFFGQKLRPYISSSPSAVAELDKYSHQKTVFLVDKALFYSSLVVYASQVFGHGDAQFLSTTQQVSGGVAVVTLLATIFINRNTNEYLKQAVDNYNTDVPANRHGAVWPRLRPAGLGIATTPQGQPMLALSWHL